MTNLTPIITNAGMNAIFRSDSLGLNLQLTHASLGDGQHPMNGDISSLASQRMTISIANSQTLNNNRIHLSVNATGTDEFWIREFGILTNDGVLFAYWSAGDGNSLAFKSAGIDLILSFDLILANVPTDRLDIVGTGNFSLPIATDNLPGIISKDDIRDLVGQSDTTQNINNSVAGLGTDISGLVSDISDTNTAISNLSSSLTGSITAFGGDRPHIPSGFLLCDGSELDRTLYASLFDAVGVYHGSGDGVDTFNIPDLRGEFIRGFDNGRGIDVGHESSPETRTIGSSQKGTRVTCDTNGDALLSVGCTSQLCADPVHLEPGEDYAVLLYNSPRGHVSSNAYQGKTRPRNIALNYIIKY